MTGLLGLPLPKPKISSTVWPPGDLSSAFGLGVDGLVGVQLAIARPKFTHAM